MMKTWKAAIVIVIITSISADLPVDTNESISLFRAVSEIVLRLLSDTTFRTLHFLTNSSDLSLDDLLSNIGEKIEGPVELNSRNYQKVDGAIMFVDSDWLEYDVIDNFKQISFLLLIVNVVNQTESVTSIISSLRTTNIVRIVIVSYDTMKSAENAVVNISEFSRYKTRNCENNHILVEISLKAVGFDSIPRNISTEKSHIDFQGCPMDIGVGLLAPFTFVTPNGCELMYSGLEVEMMKTLAVHFNFKMRFVHPLNGMQWGILRENGSTGLMAMIQDNKVDFAIGSIARSLMRNKLLKGGVGSFYDQLIFGMPIGIPYTPLQKLAMPVTNSGWIFIILACIVVSILFAYDVDKQYFDKQKFSLIDVWFILLGGLMYNSPDKFFGKLVLIGWLIVTMIFRNAYQAILFDHLKSGVEFEPILTLDDMFRAGLKFYMYNVSQRHFTRSTQIMKRYD